MDYQALYQEKLRTVRQVLRTVKSGDVILAANNYAEPGEILGNLHEIARRVERVRVWKGRGGLYPFMVDPTMRGHVEMYSGFLSPTLRKNSLPTGLVDFVPTDSLGCYTTAEMAYPPTILMAAVPPMDENGLFHLPMNHGDGELDALRNPKLRIILEVNRQLKSTCGAQVISIENVDMLVESDRTPFSPAATVPTEQERRIGEAVASLIRDGDTIQLGFGSVPDAVGMALRDKQDLGLHTEIFTPPLMELVSSGVITGARKTSDRGLHVYSFAESDPVLADFLAHRADCVLRSGAEATDPLVIARQEHIVSVNSLVEMDLTGQVCAESIGTRQISGSAGTFCFAYGAFRSAGGKGILAFPSRTAKGRPKISAILTPGAAVTIPRNYVDWVVTEQGVANLRGRSIRDRAKALISLAHPDDRAELTRQAKMIGYL